ncbi:MAG: bifunctional precorrin-2 dehydrogenase/sirohydrochlorin ferrochelatase [Syntrophales bacterium]|nr:bifunctional precorrin-2 dehydrogenase/sirohydrochlorin ferrochelatase [Syntrophales bacterium]MDD5640528.1 bifunctional precorrin-2 dehydrogenase/sirohydrochlorin ferrochelatase [Syntrophales bacterium]
MQTYPIFALIADRPCLVVGGGAVGERKVQDLLAAGAKVTVVSPELTPALAALAAKGEIRHLQGDFQEEQINGMALVIGATDDMEVNAKVSAAAQARGIMVNIVDQPHLCTFIVPAQVRRGDLTLAISTGGASPALARKLREELESHFGPEYGPYLALLQAVRTRLLAVRRGDPDNAVLFKQLVDSPLLAALSRGNMHEVRQILLEVLGQVLAAAVLEEILKLTD